MFIKPLFFLLINFSLRYSQNIPEYLAIAAQGPYVEHQVLTFALNGLRNLLSTYPNDQILQSEYSVLLEKYEGLKTQWIDASPWHVTVLYIGNNRTKLQTPYYQQFIAGQKELIYSPVFVYVPEKLMIGAVYINQSLVLIENTCPHMTLFRDNWEAVYSNNVLESLFIGDGPLVSYYPQQILLDPGFTISMKYEQMMINNEQVSVYINKDINNILGLYGETKEIF